MNDMEVKARKVALQRAATELPSAEGVSIEQQKKALQTMVNGYTIRRFCIEQAVKSAEGKAWQTHAVMDLAELFHDFMVTGNAAAKPE